MTMKIKEDYDECLCGAIDSLYRVPQNDYHTSGLLLVSYVCKECKRHYTYVLEF
jgi:transposase-like protein